MGLLLQGLYTYIFQYFCLPVFILMMIGRPRFLIRWVHKLLDFEEPFKKVKIFRVLLILCFVTVLWSYYRKWTLEKLVHEIGMTAGEHQHGNVHFIDEKLREAHLFERNTYMFFAFCIMIIIVEKFCHSYFKLWNLEDKAKEQRDKLNALHPKKDEKLKKID
jgi:hypothetical protein